MSEGCFICDIWRSLSPFSLTTCTKVAVKHQSSSSTTHVIFKTLIYSLGLSSTDTFSPCICHDLNSRALGYRSQPPEFKSWRGHVWRVFHLSLRLITFRGRSANLAYHAHKSGNKISNIVSIIIRKWKPREMDIGGWMSVSGWVYSIQAWIQTHVSVYPIPLIRRKQWLNVFLVWRQRELMTQLYINAVGNKTPPVAPPIVWLSATSCSDCQEAHSSPPRQSGRPMYI